MVDKKFLVVFGRNPDLSINELESYLERSGQDYQILFRSKSFVVLSGIENLTFIKELCSSSGSILKTGEIIDCINDFKQRGKSIRYSLSRINFCDNVKERFRWGVSCYGDDDRLRLVWRAVIDRIKQEAKLLGLKASYVWPRKVRKLAYDNRFKIPLMPDDVLKKRLLDNGFEVIITYIDNNFYLWRTIGVIPLKEFNDRDFGRPFQRPAFGISPALARTMVNLSAVKKRGIAVDPFCGIGTILQEAILSKLEIRGFDIDPSCVEKSIANLLWLSNKFNLGYSRRDLEERIMVGDARTLEKYLPVGSVDYIITEPELGPLLRKLPSIREARSFLAEAEELYSRFLRSAEIVLTAGGRLTLTLPRIRVAKGGFLEIPNIRKLLERPRFVLLKGPIRTQQGSNSLYFFRRRFIERELYVLKKLGNGDDLKP
ncbi:MAG: hypothetical protein QXU67_03265 [Candidatus Bathyarchaeia archaeon]